jgi:Ca-activated chloride channel family protein
MMIEGIKAALDFPHDRDRLRFVCFLTDGYIGNEAEIFTEIHRRLGASRIFSFGIGSSVNRYLMEGMARMGRGTVAYLGPRDSAADIMTAFFGRISHPALTDVRVDWGGWQVQELYPSQIPDLFVGRPVIVTGRFTGRDPARGIRVTGQAAGNAVAVEVPAGAAKHTGLPQAWARMKIEDLEEHALYGEATDLPSQIKELALEYGLMSAYTAFVAVDSSRRTEGKEGTTVPVPVPVPEGVKYDTTVQEK